MAWRLAVCGGSGGQHKACNFRAQKGRIARGLEWHREGGGPCMLQCMIAAISLPCAREACIQRRNAETQAVMLAVVGKELQDGGVKKW